MIASQSERVALHFAACRAAVGFKHPPIGRYWDRADWKSRRLLAQVARLPKEADKVARLPWSSLTEFERSAIQVQARAFHEWLGHALRDEGGADAAAA